MSLADFLMLNKIGEGAFSSVHKVRRISDGNIYGLKKVKMSGLKQKQKENALNQVRILASIMSPNIIGYKQAFFDENSNSLCIIMEFANGGDLEKVISKKKNTEALISEKQIWKMIKEVLEGLTILHDMQIIHRDLKSANIFISEGVYKLGDLNVSKLLKASLAYTQTGTPYYASPQVWNDKPYELKSDIWSFGCIVYEFCCLKPPFNSNSMQGLYKKIMKGAYQKIPSIYSKNLQKFISKCLQINSKNRPTCRELLKYINQIFSSKQKQDNYQPSMKLLDTIRVPKNFKSWREQLPKSKYSEGNIRQKQNKNQFGYHSQKKLRQIVLEKNPNLNKENVEQKKDQNKKNCLVSIVEKKQLTGLQKQHIKSSKAKIPSEPNEKLYQINSLIALAKKQERNRKISYNSPAWWG